jgi:queuosine biosynthesis protein QueC
MRILSEDKCMVALSGGQDSATVLSWAKQKFHEIYAVSFNYGQRHKNELECAKKLAELAEVKEHIILDMTSLFSQVTRSALMNQTDNISSTSEFDEKLPASFVPFRNLQFLTQATSLAYLKGIKNIATGVCQTDYCIPGSEFITTCRGKIPMEFVNVGDLVLSQNIETQQISFKKILNKWNRGERNDIIEIVGIGGRSIRTTSNHKIFRILKSNFNSSTGYKKEIDLTEAKNLKVGDFMLTPTVNRNLLLENNNNPLIDLLKYCDLNHPQIRYNAEHIWFKKNNKVKRFVNQNSVIGLLAWFITEGNKGSGSNIKSNSYRIGISQSKNKNPQKYDEIKNFIKDWGFNITECSNYKGDYLYFSGPSTKIFDLCGDLSDSRMIPYDFIFSNIKLLFNTLIKGDGSISNSQTTYTTKSECLKEQICWIAQMLGYSVGVHYHPTREIYNISMRNNFTKNLNSFGDSRIFKIKEIYHHDQPETVYDIEVEDNHSFFAGKGSGMLVSNSGYPDCRYVFIHALNKALNLAVNDIFIIHTPLMHLTKAETVNLMDELGTLDWYKYTNTCYNGTNCGECPACLLRIKGFKEAGIQDPLEYKQL